MAVVAVTFDGTILSLAESDSDNGVWDKYNATQTPSQETDFLFQGSFSQSNKVSNTAGGIEFEDDAATDFTTPRVVLAKIMVATPGVIDQTIAKGFWYEVGEGANGTDYYEYHLGGLNAGAYPLLKTWLVIAIDPNEVAWRDAITGTPDLTIVDYYAVAIDATGVVKSDNVVHDRLDRMDSGSGLTLVGGDSTDPDGTLLDFVAEDFDDDAARYGVILPGEAEFVINGVLTIGTSTATVYNDSNRFLVFPAHRVGEGFSGVDIGMSNASQDINLTAYTIKGLGNATVKKFFDSELEVNGTTEVISLVAHGFNTGDLVTYSNEGNTNITGLTTTTQYFVNALTVDTLALYAVGATVGRLNSFADTSRVGLTADGAGTGTNHSLTRDPDTRPDYEVTGTTGVGHTLISCTIDGARIITFTSKASMTGGFILATGSIVLGGGSMTSVIVSSPTLEEGDALLDLTATALNADLSTMDFTASADGHAIRVTATGSPGWDHNLADYWSPTDLGWNFSTAQAFTSEQLNTDAAHGFTTGDAVYYNDEGGVETIGLTDGNKYYVDVIDTDTVTLHLTKAAAVAGSNAINLTTSGSETQSLYSSKAAIFNDTSSGTLTVGVTSGNAPSFRNAPGATTVVNVSVPVSFEAVDKTDTAISGVQVSAYLISDDSQVILADTNGSGIASTTFAGSTPADIYYKYRKSSTGAQKYVGVSGFATIESDTGVSVKRSMSEDDIADPSI